MGIIKKVERLDKQVNVKVSEEVYKRYRAVREACTAKGWEFSLQPEFSAWLTGELTKAEKDLAKKTSATEANE